MKIKKIFSKSLAFALALSTILSGMPVSANGIEDADNINFYSEALNAKQVKKLHEGNRGISKEPDPVTMTVDMSNTTGDVKHGATGFLYGIGEDNVPDVNLMTAIKPYMCEQKPADGLQHPNGDILIMADTFIEAGGDSIQIACPDIYANWPYEFQGFDEYMEKLEVIVRQVKEAGLSDKAVYVLYNEPEGNWFQPPDPANPGKTKWGLDINKFNNYWKIAYDKVKAIDPEARTAGPNLSLYNDSYMRNFIKFCAENDCIPDQLTWHALTDANYSSFPKDIANVRKYEKNYWIDKDLTKEPKEIVINEYAEFTQLGVPGQLVRWIGLFEDAKATACLAYWHLSNNLCDLAASNNEPNGAWWLFKWYAEMSGETLKVETKGAARTKFYGLASLDANKKSSMVLLGGVDGTVSVTLKNVDKSVFGNKVKVKAESTSWTGINGTADAPVFVKEEICPVSPDGTVNVQLDDMVAASAYRLTVTQADDSAKEGVISSGAWRKTYEGEDAVLEGGAFKAGKSTIYACSGTGQAQGLDSAGESVTFKADLPEDGYYRFDMVYGVAAGNNVKNTEKNHPKNAVQALFADGEKIADMYLENTLDLYMSGKHTEYIKLSKGEHSLKVQTTDSGGKASIDCVYLTYIGDENALYQDKYVKTYEAELSDYNVLGSQKVTKVRTDNSIAGYSAEGYATGLNVSVKDGGGIRFTTFANENGMYNIKVKYSSDKAAAINYYVNNTNITLNKQVDSKKVKATGGGWKEVSTTLFLKKGINIIDLDASYAGLAVDTLTAEWAENQEGTTIIEAEDCETTGNVIVKENSNASGGKYVEGILADKDAKNALVVKYNAPVEGNYEFAVYQSNEELFGSHDYNAQMVDRFITLSVNGEEPQNVYFRNTYSADSFRSQVITLPLKSGDNTIKIYNSDYRVHKKGINGKDVCINYTPNLDKFEITRSALTDYKPGDPVNTPAPGSEPSANVSKAVKEKNALALDKGIKVNQAGSKITVEWGKVTGADGYDVYVQYADLKFNKKADYSVKGNTVKKLSVGKINNKKIDLKKIYKVYVNAYKLEDGKKAEAGRSITVYAAGSNSKKYTNVKAVKIKKDSYSLKAGETAKIEAGTVLYSPDKKKLPGSYVKQFRYASSNKEVAEVSSTGEIKAVKKGSCTIYVYAANGYAQKIKVKVKG